MTSTLSVLVSTPLLLILNPSYVISLTENLHLSLFTLIPASCSLCSTWRSTASCDS